MIKTSKPLIKQKLKEFSEFKKLQQQYKMTGGQLQAQPQTAHGKRIPLFLMEDIIMIDPNIALSEKVEEYLWTVCFYQEFQDLRSRISTNRDESLLAVLLQELDFATYFFQNLIMSLSAAYFKHERDLLKLSAKQIAYKCLVYLGDIARYRISYQQSGPAAKKWAEPWHWYEKATQLNSNGGKPFLQLAILASYKNDAMDVIYYNCLALGNVEPSEIARVNIIQFLKKRKQSQQDSGSHQLEDFLLFLYSVLNFEEELHIDSMLQKGKEISITESSPHFSKQAICLVVVLQDLDVQFAKSSNTASKQSIRNIQGLVLNMIFSVCMYCVNQIVDQNEKRQQDEFDAPEIIGSIRTISLICTFLSSNPSHILNFTSYGKILDRKFFSSKLFQWAHATVNLANILTSFADMEEDETAFLQSDKDIFSLSCYYERFEACSKSKSARQEDSALVYFSRIGASILKMAQDQNIDFLFLNEETGTFMVRDDDAKRKEMQRMMKALATERLKAKVEDLETKQGSFMHLDHPIYLLDLECFLFHLHMVKKSLMSKSCTIIVCAEVIQALDVLKKGHMYAVQAREAIRYLEQRFKYPSPYLVGQKPIETSSCWAEDGSFQEIVVPYPLRPILGACLYFHSQSIQRVRGTGDFHLVTDHDELGEVAAFLGVPSMRIIDFSSKLKRRT